MGRPGIMDFRLAAPARKPAASARKPAAPMSAAPAPRPRKLAPRRAPSWPAPPPPPPGAQTCAECGSPRSPAVAFTPVCAPELRLCSPRCCERIEARLAAPGALA